MTTAREETELAIGPQSIDAYSRLSYTMWYALAEFIDNTTQSRLNYESIVNQVLQQDGKPLIVEIEHNRIKKEISIKDNSIGMSKQDLIDALRIAQPTKDSKGRSKYGMGLKTAACWIGRRWRIVTCEFGSGEEWTAEIDVEAIAHRGERIPLSLRQVGREAHYTHIIINDLHRNIQKKTEETIRFYLGSMYRFDLESGTLKLFYNNEEITGPASYEIDTDPDGKPMKRQVPATQINGKAVRGWVAVLKRGGRRFGGFSLFQEGRQIQGFPNAWKPRSIFGGVEDEGANNLISQRLMGLIELDGFKVSHTKDAILFEADEEGELVEFLGDLTKDYRDYAQKRRSKAGSPWSREKVRDLLENMKKEFGSGEMKDAVNHALLPPIDTILSNNKKQLDTLTEEEKLASLDITDDLKVVVWEQERSEYEPHLTIVSGAESGVIHIIINGLHPYYCNLDSVDAVDECIRQYIYDAVAEYRVSKLSARVNPDSVRRVKNDLLRAPVLHIENRAAAESEGAADTDDGANGSSDRDGDAPYQVSSTDA